MKIEDLRIFTHRSSVLLDLRRINERYFVLLASLNSHLLNRYGSELVDHGSDENIQEQGVCNDSTGCKDYGPELEKLIEKSGIPFLLLNSGRGAVSDNNPLSLWDGGMMAMMVAVESFAGRKVPNKAAWTFTEHWGGVPGDWYRARVAPNLNWPMAALIKQLLSVNW